MRAARALTLAPLLAVLAACAADRALPSMEIDAVDAVEDLRIGSLDDPDYSFSWLMDLTVAPDGSIYSVHGNEQVVRRFGPDGRLLRVFGGNGEGPGEFRGPSSLGWIGDSLWVADSRTGRFSVFSAGGDFIYSFRPLVDLGGTPGNRPPRPRGVLADGTLWGESPQFAGEEQNGQPRPIMRMDREGAVIDTIGWRQPTRGGMVFTTPDRSALMAVGQPFSDDPVAAIADVDRSVLLLDRTARAGTSAPTFTLTKVGWDGDTIFARTYPYEPVPISSAEVDSIVGFWAERIRQNPNLGPIAGKAEQHVRDALHLPAHRPPVTEWVVRDDGSILLRQVPQADSVRWLVLGPDGDAVVTFALPTRLRVLHADSEHVWGTISDEDDVPYIVRYRIGST